MNIVRKCINSSASRKCKALASSAKLEHYCFVAYAAVEVVGMHAALWWVSGGLLLTGVGSSLWEWVKADPAEA